MPAPTPAAAGPPRMHGLAGPARSSAGLFRGKQRAMPACGIVLALTDAPSANRKGNAMTSNTVATTRVDVPRVALPRGLRGVPARLLRMILALDARAHERAHLAGLDDRTLRDVGLTRADIHETLARPDHHLELIARRRDG